MGGFGKWANMLSGHDFTCNNRHWTVGVDKKSSNKDGCDWVDQKPQVDNREIAAKKLKRPLFLPPIDD